MSQRLHVGSYQRFLGRGVVGGGGGEARRAEGRKREKKRVGSETVEGGNETDRLRAR